MFPVLRCSVDFLKRDLSDKCIHAFIVDEVLHCLYYVSNVVYI